MCVKTSKFEQLWARLLCVGLLAIFTGCAHSRKEVNNPQIYNDVGSYNQKRLVLRNSALEKEDIPLGKLSLQRALKLTFKRNPTLGRQRAAIAQAIQGVKIAESRLLPNLTGNIDYTRANTPSLYLFKHIDARNLPSGVDFNHPGVFDSVGANVAGVWNIYRGGADRLGTEIAKAGAGATNEVYRALRQGLISNVSALFLAHRAARELTNSHNATIRSVSAQLKETQIKLKGGSALKSDLLSLKARLAEAKEKKIRSEIARRQVEASLRSIMSLPSSTKLDLATDSLLLGALPSTIRDALACAKAKRPELKAVAYRVQSSILAEKQAFSSYLPSVDVQALYGGVNAPAGLDFKQGNWSLGVMVSQSLFDGGLRSSRLREAEAKTRAAKEEQREQLSSVQLEVERALLDLEEAKGRYEVAIEAVAASNESFLLVEEQFQGGSATITRYLEAEATRAQSAALQIRAATEVERAQIELARVIGILDEGIAK